MKIYFNSSVLLLVGIMHTGIVSIISGVALHVPLIHRCCRLRLDRAMLNYIDQKFHFKLLILHDHLWHQISEREQRVERDF